MDREANERKLEKLMIITKERDSQLQHLLSTAFQLANYYFVFQGVMLTAICNGSTSLRCSDRWFLFTVSFLAAALNLVALTVIGRKYLRTIAQQDQDRCECDEIVTTLQTGNERPIAFRQISGCIDPYKQIQRYICFTASMLLFLAFAGVTLSGCWNVVCRHQYDKSERQKWNDKCINFCDGGRCLKICM